MKKLILICMIMVCAIVTFGDSIVSDSLKDTIVAVEKIETVKTDFTDTFFGDTSTGTYIACFVLAFLGLYMRWYLRTRKGVKKADNGSPTKFSWAYWWKDNLIPFLSSFFFILIVIFLTLRFVAQVLPDAWEYPIGFVAVLIGLLFDYVVVKWQKIELPKAPKP